MLCSAISSILFINCSHQPPLLLLVVSKLLKVVIPLSIGGHIALLYWGVLGSLIRKHFVYVPSVLRATHLRFEGRVNLLQSEFVEVHRFKPGVGY